MESSASVWLRSMGQTYMLVHRIGDTKSFDNLWYSKELRLIWRSWLKYKWFDYDLGDRRDKTLARLDRMITMQTSSRSKHFLLLIKAKKRISEELRFVISLLSQAQENLQAASKDIERLRKERARERLEDTIHKRHGDTVLREQDRYPSLAKDPKQARRRVAEEIAAKVLDCMAFPDPSCGPFQIQEGRSLQEIDSEIPSRSPLVRHR